MSAWLLLLAGGVLLVRGSARYRLRGHPLRLRVPFRRRSRVTTETVVELIEALRDELAAGTSLRPAFERSVASTGHDVVPQALAVCRMGGDVPEALREEAGGEQLLVSLAALWQVSEGSGAAMAAALDRLIDGARDAARLKRTVAGELAAPRASARVLALLPLVGIGMALVSGANPLGFLFTTPAGLACVALAAVFEAAGVMWMRRLVRGIESQL